MNSVKPSYRFNIYQSQNDNLHEVHSLLDAEDRSCAQKLGDTFDQLNQSKCKTISQNLIISKQSFVEYYNINY